MAAKSDPSNHALELEGRLSSLESTVSQGFEGLHRRLDRQEEDFERRAADGPVCKESRRECKELHRETNTRLARSFGRRINEAKKLAGDAKTRADDAHDVATRTERAVQQAVTVSKLTAQEKIRMALCLGFGLALGIAAGLPSTREAIVGLFKVLKAAVG